MTYRPTNMERETVIVFNESEKVARVYTHNGRILRKLEEGAKIMPEAFKIIASDEFSTTYEIPKKYVNITKPRILTDEQLEELKVRFNQNK